MAVNLSKEPLKKLPEYTPVHLIDEGETIAKSSIQECIPMQAPQGTNNNLTNAMNRVLVEKETADSKTQRMFRREFLPAVKKANKSAQIQNCRSTGDALRKSLPKLLAGAFCMGITHNFSEQIAQFVFNIYLAVLRTPETTASGDMVAMLSIAIKVLGTLFSTGVMLSGVHSILLNNKRYSRFIKDIRPVSNK